MEETSNGNARVDISSRYKTEVITIRLNQKVKFGLEVLARIDNRSVAQTVERAISRLLSDPNESALRDTIYGNEINIIDNLWSPHRGARLLKLVLLHPELISGDEESIWNKMSREGLLDKYFTNPAEAYRKPIQEGFDQKQLEDLIAAYWDEQDLVEKEEASRKKKEKKTLTP